MGLVLYVYIQHIQTQYINTAHHCAHFSLYINNFKFLLLAVQLPISLTAHNPQPTTHNFLLILILYFYI